jgi:two-component system, sensor histidine kinase PdtaS
METPLRLPAVLTEEQRAHLASVADNLQLVADLGYGDVALALPQADGALAVAADARPVTAVAAVASSRVGKTLSQKDEPEAYEALRSGTAVRGARRRTTRGISFTTSAYPIGSPDIIAVVLRDLTQQVVEAPGKMEVGYMQVAEDLLGVLAHGPLVDVVSGEPFSTVRRAGDGFLRIATDGTVEYASPNAVNILSVAGHEGAVVGTPASALPGGATAIAPVLKHPGALGVEAEVGGRWLSYRALSLPRGVFALVQDVTEARRHEQELKVKEATIREVHHRVKNNLQTIASLLRIQARRASSEEVTRALREAGERIGSMAVVHEMLAGSTAESVDFADAAATVVDMVRQSVVGPDAAIEVCVEGSTGDVPASMATSLALVTAELVHNAIEHGLGPSQSGRVTVTMRRQPGEVTLTVRDDGAGLPEGFDVETSANLGLAIVKTVVEDDLRGRLSVGSAAGRGTTVTIRVPLLGEER